ncbi:MAG: DNA-binding protein [Desulfobacteraceae bacterium]|jgi:predicted DNA-binding transcriptional regulator AlpA|nr:MAG: DNA-binding protein [Desulfobacteraceae bacterium]
MGENLVETVHLQNQETADRYFDLRRLSRYSSFSVRTLRDYIAKTDNPIPSFRIGRKIIVKQSEFDAWMEKHRGKTGDLNGLVDEILDELR